MGAVGRKELSNGTDGNSFISSQWKFGRIFYNRTSEFKFMLDPRTYNGF